MGGRFVVLLNHWIDGHSPSIHEQGNCCCLSEEKMEVVTALDKRPVLSIY